MLNHSEIVDTWYFTDGELQTEQNSTQNQKKIQKIRAQRARNDYAYFLMLFANFEAYLTGRAAILIAIRKQSAKWSGRRGWDVISNDTKNINFKNRLSYCLDRTRPEWNKISGYYEIRNDLAHTGVTATAFTIPVVASDLKHIGSLLKNR